MAHRGDTVKLSFPTTDAARDFFNTHTVCASPFGHHTPHPHDARSFESVRDAADKSEHTTSDTTFLRFWAAVNDERRNNGKPEALFGEMSRAFANLARGAF